MSAIEIIPAENRLEAVERGAIREREIIKGEMELAVALAKLKEECSNQIKAVIPRINAGSMKRATRELNCD